MEKAFKVHNFMCFNMIVSYNLCNNISSILSFRQEHALYAVLNSPTNKSMPDRDEGKHHQRLAVYSHRVCPG